LIRSTFTFPKFATLLATLLALVGACGTVEAFQRQTPEYLGPTDHTPMFQLGPGDTMLMSVYGQPDMAGTVTVSDEGNIPVPLVGQVAVGGLSPSQAAKKIEQALRDGKFLRDPQVTLTVTVSRSQRVTILGQVGMPGRYAMDSAMSILDVLALAGGVTENGSDTIYLLRTNAEGQQERTPVDLRALTEGAAQGSPPSIDVKGGDQIFVPRAEQFYISGEVGAPGRYKIEPGMTVFQALARAGGVTPRGSQNRVEVKRKLPGGKIETMKLHLNDPVLAEDAIRVKESIF
jgi:polysaccharide export outer membrane protein